MAWPHNRCLRDLWWNHQNLSIGLQVCRRQAPVSQHCTCLDNGCCECQRFTRPLEWQGMLRQVSQYLRSWASEPTHWWKPCWIITHTSWWKCLWWMVLLYSCPILCLANAAVSLHTYVYSRFFVSAWIALGDMKFLKEGLLPIRFTRASEYSKRDNLSYVRLGVQNSQGGF